MQVVYVHVYIHTGVDCAFQSLCKLYRLYTMTNSFTDVYSTFQSLCKLYRIYAVTNYIFTVGVHADQFAGKTKIV